MLKQSLKNFIRWNIGQHIEDRSAEIVFQGIFANQCAKAGLANEFYPVGAAASYSLMYLLFRILDEKTPRLIIELGSGQSTLLLDRMHHADARHICYETDPWWHGRLSRQLARCDYRLAELFDDVHQGHAVTRFKNLPPADFNLLLVDGPTGTDRFSRFASTDIIAQNNCADFSIIFDDADRPGERDTIDCAMAMLKAKNVDCKLNHLRGRTCQAVITSGQMRDVSYYF